MNDDAKQVAEFAVSLAEVNPQITIKEMVGRTAYVYLSPTDIFLVWLSSLTIGHMIRRQFTETRWRWLATAAGGFLAGFWAAVWTILSLLSN